MYIQTENGLNSAAEQRLGSLGLSVSQALELLIVHGTTFDDLSIDHTVLYPYNYHTVETSVHFSQGTDLALSKGIDKAYSH